MRAPSGGRRGLPPPAPAATAAPSSSARQSADGGGWEALRLLRGDGAAGVWPVSVGAPVTDRDVGEPRRGCPRAGEGAASSAPRPAPGGARGGAGNIGWSEPASVALPASALAPGPAPAGPWGSAAGVRPGSAGEPPPSVRGGGRQGPGRRPGREEQRHRCPHGEEGCLRVRRRTHDLQLCD